MDVLSSAYNLYQSMKEDRVVISFYGDFTFDIVNNILIFAKKDLSNNAIEKSVSRKVYAILVESLENVLKHGQEVVTPEAISQGVIVLYKTPEGYMIKTGNIVEEEAINQLRADVDSIKTADLDELKMKYRKKLVEGSISSKGGAGIGLLDIAIKSNNNVNFSFKELDNGSCFFELNVIINELS